MFGVAAGGTPRGDYWALEYDQDRVRAHIGSDDSIYTFQANSDGNVFKHSKDGLIKWSVKVDNTSIKGVTTDSSGNVFFCGNTSTYGSGGYDAVIGKIDSTGALSWYRTLGASGAQYAKGIAKDSSGNLYIAGTMDPAGVVQAFIAKYNSSGTIQWQKKLSDATYDTSFEDIAIDGSDNIYVVGDADGSSTNGLFLVKYNTSGVVQWQKKWGTTGYVYGSKITTDSSGNVYVGGNRGTGYWTLLAKFNSSGTVQWARGINPGALLASPDCLGLCTDSSDNVYMAGGSFAFLTYEYYDATLAKYNSSGTIQWQHTFSDGAPFTPQINSLGDLTVAVAGALAGESSKLTPNLLQIIADGTGTGDYSTTVGGGTAFTVSTSAHSTTTLTETTATTTRTEANAGLTDALESATSSTVPTITGRYFKGPL